MRKFLVLCMALLLVFSLSSGVRADDDDFIDLVAGNSNFKVDEDGALWYKSLVENFGTNDTLTAAESGKVCLVGGDGTAGYVYITLPTAAKGLTYTIVDGEGNKFAVSPQATDTIKLVSASAGDSILSAGTVGDTITLWATASSTWYANPHGVTFTDIN